MRTFSGYIGFKAALSETIFPILYKDEQIVVIDKPAGMLVHRSSIDSQESTFVLQELRNQLEQHVFPVHRLDKPTSGILMFGLNTGIAALLSQQFTERTIKKRYWMICRGFTPDQGRIDHALVPRDDFKSRHKKQGKEVATKPAQDAVTIFKTLAKTEIHVLIDKYPSSRYSLVEAEPQTGRKHQLRRHFKHISHPIIGDPRYGKGTHNRYFAENLGCDRLLLHAQSIEFEHPVSGENIYIESMPEGVFLDVLKQLDLMPEKASIQ